MPIVPGGVAAGRSAQAWEAFEAEALPHLERLFRHAMWLERDRSVAEDLVQDTMIQAMHSFHRYTPGTNCRAWLVTILHHLRSNRRRAASRHREVEDVGDRIAETVPFVPAVPQHLTDEDILAALRGIPEPYQDIILLCDLEDMTYKEIAEALSIPMGTVMSRLHRGRAALRHQIAATADESRREGLPPVASCRGARHTVYVVSTLPAGDVQAVAQAMAGPVVRGLAGA